MAQRAGLEAVERVLLRQDVHGREGVGCLCRGGVRVVVVVAAATADRGVGLRVEVLGHVSEGGGVVVRKVDGPGGVFAEGGPAHGVQDGELREDMLVDGVVRGKGPDMDVVDGGAEEASRGGKGG